MRLTLRTLLAYLDDILEPADARDLGQKIEESEFASGLVHRIRSVSRKLRLGAPKLSGRGMGLDANTVAEYLDNTLPQDRVPDFEKVCLESDVHLAEVASCHQILTLVLGEPADVDPALADQIRSLQAQMEGLDEGEEARLPGPKSPESTDPEPTAAESLAAAVPESPPVDRRDQEHDWEETSEAPLVTSSAAQSQSSIRLLPVIGTLVVVFLLALVALIAMGPLDSDHPILGRLMAKARETSDGDPGEQQVSTPQDQAVQERDAKAVVPSDPGATTEIERKTGTEADVDGTSDIDTSTFPPPSEKKVEPDLDRAAKEEDGTAVPSPIPGNDGTVTSKTMSDGSTPEEEAKEPEPLARCASSLHILARLDPTTETWLRLTANDPIPPEQELVALPTYRPQILLSAGVHLMLIGPTAVRLREPGPDGVPGLVVHYGRILATNDGSPNVTLDLQIGDRMSRVTLPGLDTSLVLEVQRYLPPGTNPEENHAHWLIQAQATAGRLMWQDQGAADAISLETGHLASMIDTQSHQIAADTPLPDWLDVKSLRPIDRDASEHLEPLLALNRPLTTSLLEQASNRLVEIRSLAVRSLCVLGTFDSFIIDALNSKSYRAFWPDLVLALQVMTAQDPESATRIRTTLERLRGVEGSQLFRFLWGFSRQQLADGGAAALVEGLTSRSMDIRVLAYQNLYRIVEKTKDYHPELEPNRQRRAILDWQQDLNENSITYKNPPFEVGD